MNIIKTSLLGIFTMCGLVAFAQQNNSATEVINVEKSYTPSVKSKQKVQFSPSDTSKDEEKMPVTYITDMQATRVEAAVSPMSALLIPNTPSSAQYSNYIKGGFGYNVSSLLQGHYMQTFDKTTLWAKLNHDRSERNVSNLEDNSVYSHTDAALGGSVDAGKYDVGVSFKYDYNAFTNNACMIANDAMSNIDYIDKFKNDAISGQVFVKSKTEGRVFDHAVIDAHFFNAHQDSEEFAVKAAMLFNIKIKNWKIALDAGIAYYNEKYLDDQKNDLLHISALPSISYKHNRWDLMAGARIEVVGGNNIDGNVVHVMPEARASYALIKDIMNVYATFTSGYRMNTMKDLAYQCPYMEILSAPFYSEDVYKAKIGISSTISSSWRYDINASYGKTDGYLSWMEMLKIYDGGSIVSGCGYIADNVKLFNVEASLNYSINTAHNASVFFHYNHSSSDLFTKALYIPDFRIGASYRGQIFDEKVDLYARVIYNSSSNTMINTIDMISNNVFNTEAELDGYVEYYGEVAYNISSRWAVFANINNSINGRTPYFNLYTPVGFRGMAGVKFNF